MNITVTRWHDFSYGHRVYGHENKCAGLHGHNGRVHFTCTAPQLDMLGRVIDFSVIKSKLCDWVEDNWDHKFLLWYDDPLRLRLHDSPIDEAARHSIKVVMFNPTAENMAQHLFKVIGPKELEGTGITLVKVVLEETRKCSAEVSI